MRNTKARALTDLAFERFMEICVMGKTHEELEGLEVAITVDE